MKILKFLYWVAVLGSMVILSAFIPMAWLPLWCLISVIIGLAARITYDSIFN